MFLRRPKALAAWVTAVGLTALMAGCGGTDSGPELSVTGELTAEQEAAERRAGLLAEAEAAGADPTQLAILAGGVVSWEDYELAINRAIACAQDVGFSVWHQFQAGQNGFPDFIAHSLPDPHSWHMDESGARQEQLEGVRLAAWQCNERYSYFVEAAWRESPAVIQRIRDQIEISVPLIVACLIDKGWDLPANATNDELNAAFEAWNNSPESGMTRVYADDGTPMGWSGTTDGPTNPYWDCMSSVWPQVAEQLENR